MRSSASSSPKRRACAASSPRTTAISSTPTDRPTQQFDPRVDALASIVEAAGVHEAVPLVKQIRTIHDNWESRVALPLLRNPGRPDSLPIQTYGKLLTDQLRAASQELRDALATASLRVEQQLRRTINLTVAISVAVVSVFALAAVLLGLARGSAEQRLQRERSLVDALQQTLRVGGTKLPRTETGFAYASATAEALVGGDLLDSWRDGEETGWFLIADASGKGIQAARHAAFVQYAIRALAAERDDPGIVVERFNRLFIDTFNDPGIFVVLFLGRFDGRTHTLRYVGAGHSTAFVRRGAVVEQLPPTGPIVGLEKDSTLRRRHGRPAGGGHRGAGDRRPHRSAGRQRHVFRRRRGREGCWPRPRPTPRGSATCCCARPSGATMGRSPTTWRFWR